MSWSRAAAMMLIAGNAFAAAGDYVVGVGLEADSADALAGAAFGEIAVADRTWLFGSVAHNRAELPLRPDLETWYADVGVDHWFDPLGIRAAVAYWGDSDTFDSVDWRGSLYWRNDRVRLTADYEYRDFELTIREFGTLPSRRREFDANGIGASARFSIGEAVSLTLRGIDYDYSVDISVDNNPGIIDLISFSRLSLVNSLVDYRAGLTLGLDDGARHWELDYATWRGEVDRGKTDSFTLRFLTPLGRSSDIEFGLGIDESDLYGQVTFFSVFVYFYGGPR